MVTDEFFSLAQSESQNRGMADLPLVKVPHPVGSIALDRLRSLAELTVDAIAEQLLRNSKFAAGATAINRTNGDDSDSLIMVSSEPAELFNEMIERGWSDGLPVLPPTGAAVEIMVAASGLDKHFSLGAMPPLNGRAVIEKLAANAVMAGCLPEYFPLVVAATKGVLLPGFNLDSVQTTTGNVAPMIIVNGPCRHRLKINSGANVLGQGWRANATIGRFVQLVKRNIGGSYPGTTCKATLGWPGKYSICVGENEEASPWEPLHVERGFKAEQSTVTAISADASIRASDLDSSKAEGILINFAQKMDGPSGPEAIMVICPEHAKIIAGDGFSKKDVQKFIWERAAYRMKDLPDETFEQRVKRRSDLKLTRDSVIPVTDRPEDILVIVAGGDGSQSQYIHVWGQSTPEGGSTRSVTKVIRD